VIRADQAVVVQGIHNGRATSPCHAHEIIAEAEIVVEMHNLGRKFGQGCAERLGEKGIRPIGETCILTVVNAMEGQQTFKVSAHEATGIARRRVGEVKNPH
jgi:hypothetical protein